MPEDAAQPGPGHPPLASDPGGRLDTDRPCLQCGYNLRGLLPSDVCPECANPVFNSLRGDLLRFSSREYVAQLHRGVVLIQASIVGYFLLMAGTMLVGVLGASLVPSGGRIVGFRSSAPVVMTGLWTALGIASILGWWLFSARDPALGERDEGATARVVVRATVIIQAAATLCPLDLGRGGVGPQQGPYGVLDILASLLGIAAFLAIIVWWFAAMIYVRRLAPRLPSERIFRRTRLLTWLGPVLLIVICLGWLVDLILYYNLLEWIRADLKRVRAEQLTAAAA